MQYRSRSRIPLTMANKIKLYQINTSRAVIQSETNEFLCEIAKNIEELILNKHTCPPPITSVPSDPVSFCGTHAANKTVRAGNDGPAPNPTRIRNIIIKGNAYSPPMTQKKNCL